MKALKAFIKPFEAAQRSMKVNISVNFYLIQLSGMHEVGKVNFKIMNHYAAYVRKSFINSEI